MDHYLLNDHEEVMVHMKENYPLLDYLDFRPSHGDYYSLNIIRVHSGHRNSGVGTAVMTELCAIADKNGWGISLTPDAEWGGASGRNRLVRFYKRFGFVENKGRNKDWSTMAAMVRRTNDIR